MKEHNEVYLAWQEPNTKEWHVVGMLRQHKEGYTFDYTAGARASNKFITFSGMENLEKTYVSTELFPLFKNRLLSKNRPEYPSFIDWLGLEKNDVSPISILGRSGALRGTDTLQMFNRIEVNSDGNFEHVFFAHGLSHLPRGALNRVKKLTRGERLYLCLDCQNSFDKNAIIIRAEEPAEIVGYCPRYFTKYIGKSLRDNSLNISIHVEALSKNAPANYQLMCKLKGKVSIEEKDTFMNQKEFQTITSLQNKSNNKIQRTDKSVTPFAFAKDRATSICR